MKGKPLKVKIASVCPKLAKVKFRLEVAELVKEYNEKKGKGAR